MTGLDRRKDHRATGTAATEQGSLRPLQHLDTAHVIELEIVTHITLGFEGNLIEVGHHAGRRTKGGTLTANEIVHVTAGCAPLAHHEARNMGGQIVGIFNGFLPKGLGVHGGDGDRHILKALFALAGSDDDFLNSGNISGLRLKRHCQTDADCRKDGSGKGFLYSHGLTSVVSEANLCPRALL